MSQSKKIRLHPGTAAPKSPRMKDDGKKHHCTPVPSFPCPSTNRFLSKGRQRADKPSGLYALWGDSCSKKVVSDAKEAELVVVVK